MINEIIFQTFGKTYVGEVAQRFISELSIPEVRDNRFYVYEVTPSGNVMLRAVQSSFLLASNYQDRSPDRFIAYRNSPPSEKEILRKFLESRDEETGAIDCSPDPTCNRCTGGQTPSSLSRGSCLYHQALDAIDSI